MSETLIGTVTITVDMTNTNTVDLSTINDNVKKAYSITYTSGTGANAAEAMFHDQRTITASSTDSLDLSGTLANKFGTTVVFTKIKGIIVSAASANTNDVQVTSSAANGFVNAFLATSDGVVVEPGGMFCLVSPSANGYAVTAATGDLLDIINSAGGTSVVYDIIIFGETS